MLLVKNILHIERDSSPDYRLDVSIIATVLTEAMASADGDVLIFLPGQGEIQRCLAQLERLKVQDQLPNCHLFALYGAQSQKAQQQALAVDPAGVRKVIIATNVAETSLTIEGIRIVIDSGLERSMVLDLATGIERLVLRQISKASATQRAGRAGRTSAGTCYRLWSEEVQQRLVAQRDPDILQRNVSDLVLASLAWGTPLHELELLTQPRQAQLDVAYLQLSSLDAIDAGHGITEHGRALLQYPLDVRLAHMFITIQALWPNDPERLHAAALVAAHLGDNVRSSSEIVEENIRFKIHQSDKRFKAEVDRYLRAAANDSLGFLKAVSTEQISDSVLLAYPDWLALRKTEGEYKLTNGKRVKLTADSHLQQHRWLAISRLYTNQRDEIIVSEAISVEEQQVFNLFGNQIVEQNDWQWNAKAQRFQARATRKLGELELSEQSLEKGTLSISEQQRSEAWLNLINKFGLNWLPMSDSAKQLIYRVQHAHEFCARTDIDPFPAYSSQQLLDDLATWCLPYMAECDSYNDLQKLDWHAMLKSSLNWQQQQWLDEQLPTRFDLPVGQSVKLRYSKVDGRKTDNTAAPKVSAPMQWFYGFSDTPKIADGQLALQCELLSPAKRPLQLTTALGAFWLSDTYQAIKKEMKGRYPKHLWPDDPANTQATKLTKKRMMDR